MMIDNLELKRALKVVPFNNLASLEPEYNNDNASTPPLNSYNPPQLNIEGETYSLHKELIVLKEHEHELLKYYLRDMVRGNFVYYEDSGTYKLISSLRPNLLREPYWVVSVLSKGVKIHPNNKYQYDKDILDKYLNHIIVVNNWSIFNEVDKEKYTLTLNYGENEVVYKVSTSRNFSKEILYQYAEDKLSGVIRDYLYRERVITTLMSLANSSDIVTNINKFLSMPTYPLEDIIRYIESSTNVTSKINNILKIIALKESKPKKKSKKKYWNVLLNDLMDNYPESYILKGLRSGVEALLELKIKGTTNHMSKKFFKEFVDSVDLWDLVALNQCVNQNTLYNVILHFEMYQQDSRKYLLKKGVRI